MAKKPRILFLSSGDVGLGLMAEGFARAQAGSLIDVETAGPVEGEIDPFYSWAMNEAGIDISVLSPSVFDSSATSQFTHVVTLGVELGTTVDGTSVTQVLRWPFPSAGTLKMQAQDKIKAVRVIRNEIELRVRGLLTSALGRQPN